MHRPSGVDTNRSINGAITPICSVTVRGGMRGTIHAGSTGHRADRPGWIRRYARKRLFDLARWRRG
jgi:hypothetical protein